MLRFAILLGFLLAGATNALAQNVRNDPRLRARELLTAAERANNRGLLKEAEGELRDLIDEGDDVSVGRAQSLLADVLLESGQYDVARQAADEALRLLTQAGLGDTTPLRQYRQEAAVLAADVQQAMARHHERLRKPEQAIDHLRRCGQFLKQALDVPGGLRETAPVWELVVLERLARLHDELGEPDEADARWERLGELAVKLRDDNEPRQIKTQEVEPVDVYVFAVRALARYRADRGETNAAINLLKQLADQPVDGALRVILLADIARLWHDREDYREEIDWLARAIQAEETRPQPNDRRLAVLNGRRASALDALEEPASADEFWIDAAFHFHCAIDAVLLEKSDDPQRAIADSMLDMQQLQDVYQRLEKYDDALIVARDLLELRSERYRADDPRIFHTQSKIGAFLTKLAELQGASLLDDAQRALTAADAFWETAPLVEPDIHGRTLNALAGILRQRGEFESAEKLLDRARTKYIDSKDYPNSLTAPVRLSLAVSRGLVLSEQAKYREAIAVYEEAIGAAVGVGREVNELHASALLNLAMVHKSQLQFDTARSHCQDALAVRKNVLAADDPRLLPHYLALSGLQLSTALADITDYHAADESQDDPQPGKPSFDEAIDEATGIVDECDAICRAAGWYAEPRLEVGMLHHQRAMIHYLKNLNKSSRPERDEARAAWNLAIEAHTRSGHPAEKARALHYLSRLSLQDWREAFAQWTDGRKQQQEYLDRVQEFNDAVVQFKDDRQSYDRVAGDYERSLRDYNRANDRQNTTLDELQQEYDRLVDILNQLTAMKQDFKTRHAALNKAKEELDEEYEPLSDDVQQYERLRKLLDPALAYSTESAHILEQIGAYPNLHYLVLCGKADVLLTLARVTSEADPEVAKRHEEDAIDSLKAAVALVETPRAMIAGGDVARAEFFSNYAAAFDLLVRLHIRAKRYHEALLYAEQARNRTFLDQLRASEIDIRDNLRETGNPLLDEEKMLLVDLAKAEAEARLVAHKLALPEVQSPSDNADVRLNRDELARDQKEIAELIRARRKRYAEVRRAIHAVSPNYGHLLQGPTDENDLRAALEKLTGGGNPLLYYYVGQEHSYWFLVPPGGEPIECKELVAPLAIAADSIEGGRNRVSAALLARRVRRYVDRIRDPQQSPLLTSTRGGLQSRDIPTVSRGAAVPDTLLTEMILPPEVRQRVTKMFPDYVTVVPDGALHYLPLAALKTVDAPVVKFVLDEFPAIAYAPSIAIQKALVDAAPRGANLPPTALTLGNPTTALNVQLAENPPPSSSNESRRDTARWSPLPTLEHAEQEAKDVKSALDDVIGDARVKLLSPDNATERGVRDELARLSPMFIHMATHGEVDEETYNLFGRIHLAAAAAGQADPTNDGRLELHEIHRLRLTGCELVVLSACQTHVGPARPQESGATLSRAFLSAGARRVICSQWSVADKSTHDMMRIFFQRVAKQVGGQDPLAGYANALQFARQQIRRDRESPYYWAPFVLVGPGH